MFIYVLVCLSMALQIAAAGVCLRISRTIGRSLAWVLISSALVLMAVERVFLVVYYVEKGFPAFLTSNEILGLVISALLLVGMILILRILQNKNKVAAGLEDARAQAQADADRLTAVMAAAPIPIWITEDRESRFIRGNPAAMALLRMPEHANVSQSAPPGEAPTHFKLLQGGQELLPEDMPMQRAARDGAEIHDQPLELLFQDGESRHLRAYASPLRDQEGRIQGAVCSMADVTQAHQADEALAKSQKMESLGMMAGGLAHDFNNIFQVMLGNLEMAQASVPKDSRAHLYLQRLQAGLARASRISRDILYVSGGGLRRPESVDLAPLSEDILDRMGRPVLRDLSPVLPRVMVDPVLMGRVVEGLVANALEASGEQGAVRVRTYGKMVGAGELSVGYWPEPVAPGSYALLEVSDQGHGIEATALPRIFDPFYSTRDLGRGLGLAAAMGIIRSHRGGLQVESIPGVGSVFRVYLPTPEEPEALPALASQGPRVKKRVLLADDEGDLRAVLGEMLQEWFDLEVVLASDGQEALELFRQQPEGFDLVILDASMPRMGGVEAFQAMKALRAGLPGILCSGYALPFSREQAVGEGFAEFLKKPFASAELEPLLIRVLGLRMK